MLRDGMIIKGKVLRKSEGDIFVNIEYKTEGLIPKEETAKYQYYDSLNDGDEIDVHIKRMETPEGYVLLSKIIADKKLVFSRVKNAFKDNGPIDGTVIKAVKGGFIIDFGANVTAFLPMSHSKSYGEDILNRKLPLKIIQLDEEKRNVVVSYKEYVNEREKTEAEAVLKSFPVNEKAQVKVCGVFPDGVEVEKEGVKAFIPLTELSWKGISNPAEEGYKEGDIMEVLVVSSEKGKVVLSPKRLKENPFKSFIDTNKPGDRFTAKVKEVFPEGLVAAVADGLEGFVPTGELSYFRRIKDPSEIYKPGDEVKTCILKIDESKNRVILSIKRLDKNPWNNMEERYPVGARVFGVIKAVVEGDGAEVELEENIDAYVHISNVSWANFNLLSEVMAPGDKKEFRIVGVDKGKYRIMLGLKQLMASPWTIFAGRFKEGAFIDAKIIEIEDLAVVCQLSDGVTGRIPIKNKAKLKNKKGDVIKVKLVKIDKDAKKVIISGKDLEATEEQKQIDEYMKSHEHGAFKLNDIVNFGGVEKEGGDDK